MDKTSETNISSPAKDIMEIQSESLGAPLILEDSTENALKDHPPVDLETLPKIEDTLDLFGTEDILLSEEKTNGDEEENEIIDSSQPNNENRKRKINNHDISASKITKIDSDISSVSDRTNSFDSNDIKDKPNVEELNNKSEIPTADEAKILPFETNNGEPNKAENPEIITEKVVNDIIENKEMNGEDLKEVENSAIDKNGEGEINQNNLQNLQLVKENSLSSSNHVSPFLNLKDTSSTPNTELSKSPNNLVLTDTVSPDSSIESKNSFCKKSAFYVEIIYSMDEKDPGKKEVQQVICEDLTPSVSSKRLSDVSSGVLGDTSKSISPSSVISLQEPCPLSNRASTASTTRLSNLSRMSSSSTSSTFSSRFNENFLVPNIPLINRIKDKNFLDKKATPEQLDLIKANWIGTEKLLHILHQIDCNGNSINTSAFENSPKNHFDSGIASLEVSKAKEENDISSIKKRGRKENKTVSSAKSAKNPSQVQTDLKTSAKKLDVVSNGKMTPQRQNKSAKTSDTPVTDSSVSENSGLFTVGQSVFARWTDKFYYSGKILGYIKDQTWNIKFDDGGKKAVKEEFIIGNCHNLLKGVSVYVIIDKERNYDTGIVTKLWIEKDLIHYEVMVDNGPSVVVSAPDIFLTEDQALCVKKLITHTPPGTSRQLSEVTLDNIVDGKRSTRSSRRKLISSKSRTDKIIPRKIITNEAAIEAIPGVEAELQASTPIKKDKGPTTKRLLTNVIFNIEPENIVETLGPIPEKGSNLFKDLQFILVCVNNLVEEVKKSNGSSSEADTDTEAMTFSTVPFDDERLKNQIIAAGGTVYQHFEDIPIDNYSTCKLISNRPNKTAKYVQCLAAGMTLICHEWIIRCCRLNKLLPFQELPTGWSVEKEKFIESYQRASQKPLEDCLVMIAPHNDKQFIRFWNRVCSLAGGTVTEIDSDDMDFQAATFILGDTDCSERIVDQARLLGIPILSTAWVVQTLIHGKTRGFDAHPSYSFDFVESD